MAVIRDADETTKQAADAAVDEWTRVTWITKDKKTTSLRGRRRA